MTRRGEVGTLTTEAVADSIGAAVLACLGERTAQYLVIRDDRAGVEIDMASGATVRGGFDLGGEG